MNILDLKRKSRGWMAMGRNEAAPLNADIGYLPTPPTPSAPTIPANLQALIDSGKLFPMYRQNSTAHGFTQGDLYGYSSQANGINTDYDINGNPIGTRPVQNGGLLGGISDTVSHVGQVVANDPLLSTAITVIAAANGIDPATTAAILGANKAGQAGDIGAGLQTGLVSYGVGSGVNAITAPAAAAGSAGSTLADLTPAQIESAVNTPGYGASAAASNATGAASGLAASGAIPSVTPVPAPDVAAPVPPAPTPTPTPTPTPDPTAVLTGSDAHIANIAAGTDTGASLSGTLPSVSTVQVSPWSANSLVTNFGNNALTNAEMQAILTGKIDPTKAVIGGATGTLGGAISSSVAPALTDTLPSWAIPYASNAAGATGIAALTGQPLDKAIGNSLLGTFVNNNISSPIADFTGSGLLGGLAGAWINGKLSNAINGSGSNPSVPQTMASTGPLTTTSTAQPYNPGVAYDPMALGHHDQQVYGSDSVFKQGLTA